MNPYDFARIDWNKPPERRKPIWHNRFVGPDAQKLYSGSIEVDVYVEAPVFIADPRTVSTDPRKPAQFIKNSSGAYIIPGSSLKGLLRSVVETIGNGCLTLFDGNYERDSRGGRVEYQAPYKDLVDQPFRHCSDNTRLCIACRIFGMLKEGARGIFLGKVNIGDAIVSPDRVYAYDPIYTAVLVNPKPHHRDFYLDPSQRHIAGRKFYFHHAKEQSLLTANGPAYFGRTLANRYIHPLDFDTMFHFRVDFTNLEADEFAALLLAITLEEGMRHKIGYAKPLGLGSVQLLPTSMILVDYATRYSQPGRGKTLFEGDVFWSERDRHVNEFAKTNLAKVALDDLRRIWRWPADPNVDYSYPSKRDWFDTEDATGKRIADTKNVPG